MSIVKWFEHLLFGCRCKNKKHDTLADKVVCVEDNVEDASTKADAKTGGLVSLAEAVVVKVEDKIDGSNAKATEGYVDKVTGKVYKTKGALKAAQTRRKNKKAKKTKKTKK